METLTFLSSESNSNFPSSYFPTLKFATPALRVIVYPPTSSICIFSVTPEVPKIIPSVGHFYFGKSFKRCPGYNSPKLHSLNSSLIYTNIYY